MNSKTIFQSKTCWIGLSTICLGIGMYVNNEQNLQELLIAIMGVVFTVLRFYTTMPVTK